MARSISRERKERYAPRWGPLDNVPALSKLRQSSAGERMSKGKNETLRKLKGNPELRRAAERFLNAFKSGVIKRQSLGLGAYYTPGYRFSDDLAAKDNDEVRQAEWAFCTKAAAIVPAKFAHHSGFARCLWKQGFADVRKPQPMGRSIDELCNRIVDDAYSEIEVFAPCSFVLFDEEVKELALGPVALRRTQEVEFANLPSESTFLTWKESMPGASLLAETQPKTPLCWHIRTSTVQENVAQEARWMAEITVSLMRLWIDEAQFAPSGEEPHPFHDGTGVRNLAELITGFTSQGKYLVTASHAERISDSKFQELINLIFAAGKDQLAARVASALGWLARARQAIEAPDCLLFSFTALEALLSISGEPVTQTISRYGAALLQDDPVARFGTASDLTKLYEFRSKLVHQGDRDLWHVDCLKAYFMAEGIVQAAIREFDAAEKYSDFIHALKRASYGQRLETAIETVHLIRALDGK